MRHSRGGVVSLGVGWVVLALVTAVSAQTSLAALRGKVTDEQGGVLPGATVTARQTETNIARSGVTNETGQFYLPSLPAGTYELTVELAGFSTAARTVVLRVGQEGGADFSLKVGALAETIQVSAASALVETKSTLGGLVDRREIDNLPTIDRNFAGLAQLAPGVSSSGGSSMGFSAAGQRQYQNQIFMDGATNAQQFYGTQAESYPQDWIQEFQVMTTGYSAEFGQATGGVLNVITRSGANNLQGRVYGFYRTSDLDEAPFAGRFANGEPVFLERAAAVPQLPLRRVSGWTAGEEPGVLLRRLRELRQHAERDPLDFGLLARAGRAGDHPGRKHQPRLHGEDRRRVEPAPSAVRASQPHVPHRHELQRPGW